MVIPAGAGNRFAMWVSLPAPAERHRRGVVSDSLAAGGRGFPAAAGFRFQCRSNAPGPPSAAGAGRRQFAWGPVLPGEFVFYFTRACSLLCFQVCFPFCFLRAPFLSPPSFAKQARNVRFGFLFCFLFCFQFYNAQISRFPHSHVSAFPHLRNPMFPHENIPGFLDSPSPTSPPLRCHSPPAPPAPATRARGEN